MIVFFSPFLFISFLTSSCYIRHLGCKQLPGAEIKGSTKKNSYLVDDRYYCKLVSWRIWECILLLNGHIHGFFRDCPILQVASLFITPMMFNSCRLLILNPWSSLAELKIIPAKQSLCMAHQQYQYISYSSKLWDPSKSQSTHVSSVVQGCFWYFRYMSVLCAIPNQREHSMVSGGILHISSPQIWDKIRLNYSFGKEYRSSQSKGSLKK